MAWSSRRRGTVAVSLALWTLLASVASRPPDRCRLVHSLRAEIAGYRPAVDRVLSYVRAGYRGRVWDALAAFVDAFGSRLAGTPDLERAIDYATDALRAAGLDRVHTERVQFTGWRRYLARALPRAAGRPFFPSRYPSFRGRALFGHVGHVPLYDRRPF